MTRNRSLEFSKWFQNSVVTDRNGNPLIVYHATNYSFTKLNRMLWASSSSHFANLCLRDGFYGDADILGANIMPIYLRILNPINLKGVIQTDKFTKTDFVSLIGANYKEFNEIYGNWSWGTDQKMKVWMILNQSEVIVALLKLGFDGIVWEETLKSKFEGEAFSDTYAVFSPNQVKSAIGNNGKYSLSNNHFCK